MEKPTCTIEGCDRQADSRGWCLMHYKRWRKHGDPNITLVVYTAEESFSLRTRRDGECLIWTGALDTYGYGNMRANGRNRLVHRWAWEQTHGPIPAGMEIDHYVCFNRACCELSHLRLVTHQQNGENRTGAYLSNKTSGVRGVHWNKWKSKWEVKATHRGKRIYGGVFESLSEATNAAIELRNTLHTHNEKDRLLAKGQERR